MSSSLVWKASAYHDSLFASSVSSVLPRTISIVICYWKFFLFCYLKKIIFPWWNFINPRNPQLPSPLKDELHEGWRGKLFHQVSKFPLKQAQDKNLISSLFEADWRYFSANNYWMFECYWEASHLPDWNKFIIISHPKHSVYLTEKYKKSLPEKSLPLQAADLTFYWHWINNLTKKKKI